MNVPSEPPGFWKEVGSALAKIVEVFVRPLAVVSNAISERLAIRLRRKPKLHVHFHPYSGIWCIATEGTNKIMQIGFQADFTHDDPRQTLILVDAFPEDTRSKLPFRERIDINPEELVTPEYQVWMMVTPVIGDEGKKWVGRIVFVDQFKRKYKSDEKFEFMWGGPAHPASSNP